MSESSAEVTIRKHGTVQGILTLDNGAPANYVSTRLYDIGFAGDDTRLGETRTDAHGNYEISYEFRGSTTPSLQVRVLDRTGAEVTLSYTKFNAGTSEKLDLIVPLNVQPLDSEYQRLSADMEKSIGGVAKLGEAKEDDTRQDLSLLNQSTNWDARVLALAATSAQQSGTTGVSQDALYALYRVGLPTDPSLLAGVPVDTLRAALAKAQSTGIVTLSEEQSNLAIEKLQTFASRTLLASKTPGAVSTFGSMISGALKDSTQQAAFTNLYLTQATASDFWSQAAALKIPGQTLEALKLQGKLLYLTFNSAPLTQLLQKQLGSLTQVSQIVYKDFYKADTWQTALSSLAGKDEQALGTLIPSIYPGATTNDRVASYAADLARKVRISFPTETTARMIDNNEIVFAAATAGKLSTFLKSAAAQGYKLGRTPLNTFLKKPPAGVAAPDADTTQALKTLHRLFQVTPSPESLQTAVKLGFTSARDIANLTKNTFLNRHGTAFPPGEAQLIFGQAQIISSVTFNAFAMAKQLDTAAPTYVLSGPASDTQAAKNAVVQQFPSMASLFGDLDFCQCEDCRSVLSPAAYFVDVMEFLNKSTSNAQGYTPLDVLIGKDKIVAGRRPDLAAVPLTCENTNTAMPYIDLVNEILEYFIANSHLDANAAYDTGGASTADLTAEPQHIIASVYNGPLKQAAFPPGLPFDLWIETVRGFLGYFKQPLAEVLHVLRPADTLELFTDANHYPYYRAQILAERLGLSPAEYALLTSTDPATQTPSTANWFKLYGYKDEPTALAALKSAKTLSQALGLTYQEVTDLVTTGFLNPSLYSLIFQFQRFGIETSDAFSYTAQPGWPALSAAQKTVFEALLDSITALYVGRNPASSFNARTWLTALLPANYSKKVLVLDDPDSGCDFSGTALQYADGSPAVALDFLRFSLFARLWKKLGWSLDEVDRALQAFLPAIAVPWSDPNFAPAFSASWKTALVYLAHLDDLNTRLSPALGRTALLPFWTSLPVLGAESLYAQIFLASGVLNGDWAFDDPNGQFPTPLSDFAPPPATPFLAPLSAHQATIQGVLGLSADDITAILASAGAALTTIIAPVNGQNVAVPAFNLTNLSICYRYGMLAGCLQLTIKELVALMAMSGINPFPTLSAKPLGVLADDVLLNGTLAFVKQAAVVQNSGFTVEDLQYLLRQQFDPLGIYQTDPNVLITLMQTLAAGLGQIRMQNTVPANFLSLPESLIDQTLSGLFPAGMLTALFNLLADSQTITAIATNVIPANKLDGSPFAAEPELSFSYDPVADTQTVTYTGLLLDWEKAALEKRNASALFAGLLDQLQTSAQQALSQRVGDLLGVWASLIQYQAVQTGVTAGLPAAALTAVDAALTLTYDQAEKLQWLGYRGVLTDAKKSAVSAVALSPALTALLNALLTAVQQQALPAFQQVAGSVMAMWTNQQTYLSTQASAAALDSVSFMNAIAAAKQTGTLVDPVPSFEFSFDAASNTQTLRCTGVLTDALRMQLESLPPATPLLGTLLQDVRNQAAAVFQLLGTGLITVAATDLDNFSRPLIGIDPANQRQRVKAGLVQAFLPLQSQKLSRQFLVQSMASNLASDPTLTEALMTDAGLLSDPTVAGTSLLGTFQSLGVAGVSASYFTSADGSGTAQTSGIALSPDTADPTNSKSGTASAHFEGYLQVLTDGPYRFFAELGDVGAAASLHIDSPDPTALLNNPIISAAFKAAKAADEISQFVQLKGGVPYHFTVDFSALGKNGASLLVQGELLAKGALTQIRLYPEQTLQSFTRAKTLLSKVLQIIQVTGLDLREVTYVIANSAQFGNPDFSALPSQPADDSPTNAVALFAQFLALADYADLRKGPAGGTDGLIDVLQAAAQASPQEPNTPWTLLANLTRRSSATVQAVATALGPNPHFSNSFGIRRLWEAMQLVQVIGIPVATLAASTVIASPQPVAPDQIATSFRNAVQSQYTAAQWQPIAQSVFDPLRKKKRDALVAYLLQSLSLQKANELFEYFLVDPGMEPVVQTSRLRLAMSSVQTFIQRCLLNLENANSALALNVSPASIDAATWEWMKRYRVWQANREIFLFPENWMEPELRLDKTDLFQALESSLLQGDVTSDLVEAALLKYLQDLDVRARLDIVASYFDQNLTDASFSTLHVLGRTYAQPHKYFYRNFATGAWSAWEALTLSIEGDHIALAIWRGRLHVFWVTFIAQPQPPQSSSASSSGAVANLGFDMLTGDIFTTKAQQRYQLQLHWSDYFQGKWSTPIASDVSRYDPVGVNDGFDASRVYIRVATEVADNGGEGAVRVYLDFPFNAVVGADLAFDRALQFSRVTLPVKAGNPIVEIPEPLPTYVFRVTSKNCDLTLATAFFDAAPVNPYKATGVDSTLHTGSGTLVAKVDSDIASDESSTEDDETILGSVGNYALLACGNPVSPSPFLPSGEPLYQEAGSLVAPFFFKDTHDASNSNELTFFVEPSLTEKTVIEWPGFGIAPPPPPIVWSSPIHIQGVDLVPQVPTAGTVAVNHGDPIYSVFQLQDQSDWVTAGAAAISYGGTVIGQNGGLNVGAAATNTAGRVQ